MDWSLRHNKKTRINQIKYPETKFAAPVTAIISGSYISTKFLPKSVCLCLLLVHNNYKPHK